MPSLLAALSSKQTQVLLWWRFLDTDRRCRNPLQRSPLVGSACPSFSEMTAPRGARQRFTALVTADVQMKGAVFVMMALQVMIVLLLFALYTNVKRENAILALFSMKMATCINARFYRMAVVQVYLETFALQN
jgi:hypothetical protein